MEKYQADELALQLVNSILKTEPSALASGSAAVDAIQGEPLRSFMLPTLVSATSLSSRLFKA